MKPWLISTTAEKPGQSDASVKDCSHWPLRSSLIIVLLQITYNRLAISDGAVLTGELVHKPADPDPSSVTGTLSPVSFGMMILGERIACIAQYDG